MVECPKGEEVTTITRRLDTAANADTASPNLKWPCVLKSNFEIRYVAGQGRRIYRGLRRELSSADWFLNGSDRRQLNLNFRVATTRPGASAEATSTVTSRH